jgi:hypothetical protein
MKEYKIIFGPCNYCKMMQRHLLFKIQNHTTTELELKMQYLSICCSCGFRGFLSDSTLNQYMESSEKINLLEALKIVKLSRKLENSQEYKQRIKELDEKMEKINAAFISGTLQEGKQTELTTVTLSGERENYQVDKEWVRVLEKCGYEWDTKTEKFLNRQLWMAIPARYIVEKTIWQTPEEFTKQFDQIYQLYLEDPKDFAKLAKSTRLFPLRNKIYTILFKSLWLSVLLGWLIVGWSLWFQTVLIIGVSYFLSDWILDKFHLRKVALGILAPFFYILVAGYNHLAMIFLIIFSLMYLTDKIAPPTLESKTLLKMAMLDMLEK